MLKQLFIIRHAKSDQRFWGNDFERPLNDRGEADAPVIAKRLKDRGLVIDAWVASPAVRAKRTAELFAETFASGPEEIVFISALYHAPPEVFSDVIRGLPDNLNSVAIFSHNPGITYFVNSLVADVRIDNMPTCGVFAVQSGIKRWEEFARSKKEFLFFDHPKK